MKKNITVFDQSFTIICQESEIPSIDLAQQQLNQAIQKVRNQVKTDNRERILIMAGLTLTQTLLEEKSNNEHALNQLISQINQTLTQ